ncbi:hypothetical protein DAQ1742_03618 [Dickeya aquatica]|uniref:Uncharacterized protein n=1 Tax=Dickeya aquatica TaxID=1401087 RepID=A0A375AE91_9GAMM|nr:hypothetical protein DAQ1742_03618 [Dickeya aquatica]
MYLLASNRGDEAEVNRFDAVMRPTNFLVTHVEPITLSEKLSTMSGNF